MNFSMSPKDQALLLGLPLLTEAAELSYFASKLCFISQSRLEKRKRSFSKHHEIQEPKYYTVAVRADKTSHPLSYAKVLNTPKLSTFSSWTAGTVKHSTSPHKPFFSLFISIVVVIHCQKFKPTLSYCPYNITAPPGNMVCFMPPRYCHACSPASTASPGDTQRGRLLTFGFILLKYTQRVWRKTRVSRNSAEQRPNRLMPIWAWFVPHPAICSPNTIRGHYCHLRLLIQGNIHSPSCSWQWRTRTAEGREIEAMPVSSPVFTAGVPVQLFRKQAQLQYPVIQSSGIWLILHLMHVAL